MILIERKPIMPLHWNVSSSAATSPRRFGVSVALMGLLGVFALGAVLGWVWAQYLTPGMLLAHLQGWSGCFVP